MSDDPRVTVPAAEILALADVWEREFSPYAKTSTAAQVVLDCASQLRALIAGFRAARQAGKDKLP